MRLLSSKRSNVPGYALPGLPPYLPLLLPLGCYCLHSTQHTLTPRQTHIQSLPYPPHTNSFNAPPETQPILTTSDQALGSVRGAKPLGEREPGPTHVPPSINQTLKTCKKNPRDITWRFSHQPTFSGGLEKPHIHWPNVLG